MVNPSRAFLLGAAAQSDLQRQINQKNVILLKVVNAPPRGRIFCPHLPIVDIYYICLSAPSAHVLHLIFIFSLLFIVLPLFVVSNPLSTSHHPKKVHSHISHLLSSRMKFLLVTSALLSVGLVQGLDCPSEGVTCQDPSGVEDADIDCNVGVLTWEDCGKFDMDYGACFNLLSSISCYQ